MKLKSLIIVFLLSISSLLAGEKFDKLTTLDGKTYNKVEVTKKSLSDVTIVHQSGIARIRFQNLDANTIKLLGGYDPKKAQQHAALEKAQLEAAEAALDAQIAKSGKLEKPELQTKKLDKVKLEKGKLQPSNLQPSKGLK